MTSDLTTKAAEIRAGLVAELRERTAFRFAGDCKCGKCQLVPRTLVDEAAALIEQQAAELAEARAENERLIKRLQEKHREVADLQQGPLFKLKEDILARATTAESERDSWRRVCERLETEKQAALAERDELLREKERLGAGWRPIETAPTDYTHVIGMDAKGNVSRTWFFAPSSMTRDWLKVPGNGKWKPIYWMPLLEPSEGSGQNLADANSKSPSPSSQSERIAVLEAVLRPFADVADVDEETGRDDPDDDRILVVQAHGCQLAELSTEDFRRARSALAPLGEE